MKTFNYSLVGRERGAIGISYKIIGKLDAISLEMAENVIRDTYEVFHSFTVVEIEQPVLAAFNTLPDSMMAYIPNKVAQPNSPAKRASDLGHVWVRGKCGNSYRHVFDSDLNHLFSGSNDDLRAFYNCEFEV